MRVTRFICAALAAAGLGGGCAAPQAAVDIVERPDVSPTDQPHVAQPLHLDASQIRPMYTQMLAVDLPAVVRVAAARNFDIRRARQAVEADRGRYESAVGAAFPAIVPTAIFEHVAGTVRATEGDLVGVGFDVLTPSVAIQWVINPGSVIYEIIAARKRLAATEHQQQAVVLETLRRAAVEYYTLVLTQATVSAAHQGVTEAEELLRIERLRLATGTGVLADQMRAEARLAQRQQELVTALNGLYNASVSLAVTLHLDSSVTLVPSIDQLPPTQLVRRDIDIEELLGIAVAFRPDLKSVRQLAEAATADQGRNWWGGFGPALTLSYQYGGITGHADNVESAEGIPSNLIVNPASPTGAFGSNPIANGLTKEGILRGSRRLDSRDDQTFGFSDQQRATAGVGWRLSLSAFGDLKTASAKERQALIEAQRRLDAVKAQVVTAAQGSEANRQLIELSHRQVASAAEALRLSQVNLRAGTTTTLDVLQAQDAATQARLRHAEAVVHYNQSQVNLLAALGLLDSESLGLRDDAPPEPDAEPVHSDADRPGSVAVE